MGYSQSWLEDGTVKRCILVELVGYSIIGSIDTTFYLSNIKYITEDGLTFFEPSIIKSPSVQESISTDGGISVSYGDFELRNTDASYDEWLDSTKWVWSNRSVKVYYGDPSWTSTSLADMKTQFELVFDGIIEDIDSRNRDSINFKIRDKMERLNTPLSENKLGTYGTWAGGQQNQDTIRPLVFGEPHNIEPLLVDPSTLTYMVSDGAVEDILEIRDNGVPIYDNLGNYTGSIVNLSGGLFTLKSPLAGVCTATVQGVKKSFNSTFTTLQSTTYANTLAHVLAVIVTQYGSADTKLSISELDSANLTTFNNNNPSPIGLYVTDRVNVLEVCKQLVSSVGATLYFSRTGLLQVLQLGVPTADPSVDITKNDIIYGTFGIAERTQLKSSIKLAYAKNWTVQSNLLTSITEAHKEMYSTEWNTVTSTNGTVKTLYKQFGEPPQVDTLLITKGADEPSTTAGTAAHEAKRLREYYDSVHTVYEFTGTSKLLSLKLGQPATLFYDRFDLAAGKSGQIVSLSPNWSDGTINVGILI